jgi:hypothetical protein
MTFSTRLSFVPLVRSPSLTSGIVCAMVFAACAEVRGGESHAKPGAAKTEPLVGFPFAPGVMPLVEEEIADSLKQRGQTDHFDRFGRYAVETLKRTAGAGVGSEMP